MPKVKIEDFTWGLNLKESSLLEDNQFESLKNMFYDADWRLRSRHWTKTFGDAIGSSPITSSYFLDDQKNNIRTLLAVAGDTIYKYVESTEAWISIKTWITEFEADQITRTRFSFAPLREIIYMCNGVDSYFKYDPLTDTFSTIWSVATPAVAFDNTTDTITSTAHTLNEWDSVRFTSWTLPVWLDNRFYYVRNPTANTYQISFYPTDTIIDFADDGTGPFWGATSTQPRCRYLEFLADAIYGAWEDRNPSTLYVTNAVWATASNADNLAANDLFVWGAESGRINALEELQESVLAYKDKKVFNIAGDLTSSKPTDAENWGYGDRAIQRVSNALLYFNDRWFTTLKAKSGATSTTALQDKPLSDDVRALLAQVLPKNYNFTIANYILPLTNYYGSFSTNEDDRPDTTLVYSSLTEGWSQYTYPNHYGFVNYKDSDGIIHYLLNSATSGQMIEMETGFDDLWSAIDVEACTKKYDLWDETESDSIESITLVWLKSEWDDITVDIISDDISIGGWVITDDYINVTSSVVTIGQSPIGERAIWWGAETTSGVDLYKYIIRFPLYDLIENIKIKMTSSSKSLVWTIDKATLEFQNESRDLFEYNNLW